VKQNVLDRSIILGQLLEEEIAATHKDFVKQEEKKKIEQHEEAKALFKNTLEHIIENQARVNPLPGMVPPLLPKQIDMLKPLVDSEQPQQIEKEKDTPNQLGESKPAEVKLDKFVASLAAKPSVIDIGNPIQVEWEISSGQTSTAWDWIGLFCVDQPNKQYVTYQWTGKLLTKGSLSFLSPTIYGEYEFRFFPNGYYQHAAMSNRIKVGPQIDLNATLDKTQNKIVVTWKQISGNSYPKAWIGLYEKPETNNHNYIAWNYASKSSNELSFDAPFKPREYELRFFSNSYIDVARSNALLVEGQDKISATCENGMIAVKLNVVTVDPYYESAWLGVYFTHETNNRQWRRYKYFSNRKEDTIFKAPRTQGQYEVRMFANKTYDMILKSDSFTIPGNNM